MKNKNNQKLNENYKINHYTIFIYTLYKFYNGRDKNDIYVISIRNS